MKRIASTPERIRIASFRPETLPGGKVDLRDVSRDDRLGAEAEAGQEHLHLLGGRVLRLVEDDEGVVQRAAPHEGERGDLDDLPLEEPPDLLVAEDVVEGVVERAEVGVHLLGEVARQEAELLARLHRGAAEDDPA